MKVKMMAALLCFSALASLSCSKGESAGPGGGPGPGNTPAKEEKILVAGYLPDYGINRIDLDNLGLVDRVYYFSIEPDANGYFQMPDSDSTNIEKLKLKLTGSQELFLVVGGWIKSQYIPVMASSAEKRSAYIRDITAFCKRHNLKGVDLDWEDYPAAVNQASFVTLVKEFYNALHPQGLKFSIALGVEKAAWGYQVRDHVDDINLMIYGKLDASGNQSTMLQTKNALNSYADLGISRKKLHAGVPFYGKRAAAPVAIEYYNIVAQAPPVAGSNIFGSYSFNGKTMLQEKTAFLRQAGYGGIFAWELSQDVSATSEYSLLKCIYDRNK